jgi:hypothetical protein
MAELAASLLGIISVGTKVTLVLFQVCWRGCAMAWNRNLGFLRRPRRSEGDFRASAVVWILLDSLKSMGVILDHCKEILERIQSVVDKLTRQSRSENPQKMTYIARAKWVFHRRNLDASQTKCSRDPTPPLLRAALVRLRSTHPAHAPLQETVSYAHISKANGQQTVLYARSYAINARKNGQTVGWHTKPVRWQSGKSSTRGQNVENTKLIRCFGPQV